jgi:hypothetical protein
VAPALERLGTLAAALGQVDTVLANSGCFIRDFSAANLAACEAAGIAPLVAL